MARGGGTGRSNVSNEDVSARAARAWRVLWDVDGAQGSGRSGSPWVRVPNDRLSRGRGRGWRRHRRCLRAMAGVDRRPDAGAAARGGPCSCGSSQHRAVSVMLMMVMPGRVNWLAVLAHRRLGDRLDRRGTGVFARLVLATLSVRTEGVSVHYHARGRNKKEELTSTKIGDPRTRPWTGTPWSSTWLCGNADTWQTASGLPPTSRTSYWRTVGSHPDFRLCGRRCA